MWVIYNYLALCTVGILSAHDFVAFTFGIYLKNGGDYEPAVLNLLPGTVLRRRFGLMIMRRMSCTRRL